MIKKRFCLVFLLMFGMQGVNADEILLQSGERFTGTLQRLDAEETIVETSYAGTIAIPSAQIAGIVTDAPVTVVFEDGSYLTGRLVPQEGDAFGLRVERTDTLERFELAEVQGIYRGDPRAVAREAERVRLEGAVNVGALLTSGNSDTTSYHLDGQLRATTPQNRYSAYAELNREESEDEESADNALGFIKYDHFLTERLYIFNSATFERDEFADLDLRTTLAVGPGYQFFDTPERFLYGELGVAYISTNYDEAEDESAIGGRWAVEYEELLFEGVRFFHFQEGLLGGAADLFVRTRTGLRFLLNANFQAVAEVDVDYTDTPVPGVSSTDKSYIFTLGYLF